MSMPSIETDTIDDDMSITVHDLSDTTVATQTSTSWHSVMSDVHISNSRFVRSHSINTWVKMCSIEPDIRLTTAQEWKLRTCMRRLLSLCDLPLKISCLNTEQYVSTRMPKDVISLIDQKQQSLSIVNPSSINHSGSNQNQPYDDQLEQLGLYLHILPVGNSNNDLLEVKLFEYYSKKSSNSTIVHIPIVKSPRFVFHISLNVLILSVKGNDSLLELRFLTRDNEGIRGHYYQWNEMKNEHRKFSIHVEVDQNLLNELHTT
ncbi:hypothetical protein I4U23_019211 [Adineta vaga]|nr:hypothetical protein I4U23_019211 [Adineta vaga]